MKDSKNILVTGATGFIGSYLCKELIQKRYNVFGFSPSNDFHNIKPLLKQKNFHRYKKSKKNS